MQCDYTSNKETAATALENYEQFPLHLVKSLPSLETLGNNKNLISFLNRYKVRTLNFFIMSATFDFSTALGFLRKGEKAARVGWNGKDMFIELQSPDENSKMTLPYLYIRCVDGNLVPWLASQTDLLSEDWFIID